MTELEKKIGEIKVGYPDCCYSVGGGLEGLNCYAKGWCGKVCPWK